MEEVVIKELERKLLRLSKFLSRKWAEVGSMETGLIMGERANNRKNNRKEIKIREIPGLMIDEEGFKGILLRRRESAGKIVKRFQDNLREIKKLKREIVEKISSQAVAEELKSRNRLLVSELVMASEIEKVAPVLKRMLSLLSREESLKGTLKKVREEFKKEV